MGVLRRLWKVESFFDLREGLSAAVSPVEQIFAPFFEHVVVGWVCGQPVASRATVLAQSLEVEVKDFKGSGGRLVREQPCLSFTLQKMRFS
jgi:hypothetical protein